VKHSLLLQFTFICVITKTFIIQYADRHTSVCIIATSRARKFKLPLPRSTVLFITHRWSRAHCSYFSFVLIFDHFYRCSLISCVPRLTRSCLRDFNYIHAPSSAYINLTHRDVGILESRRSRLCVRAYVCVGGRES